MTIVEDKTKSFLADGKEKLHLILDFDMTLTKTINQFGEHVATWQLLMSHLSEKGKKEYQNLYNRYRPLEAANKMTNSVAVEWWEETLNLLVKNRLKWSDILSDVEERMPVREGVKELFDICEQKEIPILIISGGIRDVIEVWCQKLNIKPAIILSTNLNFDSKGFIKGWDKNSLIHAFNKKEQGHEEVSKIRKLRPNTILVGDSPDDYSMVDGDEMVLRILIDDPRPGESLLGNNAKKDKFDMIIKDKSLFPVVEMIKFF